MVRDIKHATKIQERRVSAGLKGYAKAVRRFLLREYADDEYADMRQRLPVRWGGAVTG